MIKVLMVGNDSSVKGGITTVINQFRNHDWIADNIDFIFIPTYIDKNKFYKTFFFIIAYLKILFCFIFNTPNIIHIHMSYKGSFTRGYLIQKLAKVFKIRNIVHIHGSEFKKWYDSCSKNKQQKIKLFLKNSNKVIVLGDEWKKKIESIESTANIIILNNSVLMKESSTLWRNKTFQFLFLGVLIKRKGVFDLLEAISLLKANNKLKDVKFIIAGSGKEEKNLKKQAKFLNIEEYIEFVGWIDSTKKDELFKSSQCMILPSYNEGLPMSILEAMSYGLPIIATNVGDIDSVVKDNKNGLLIKPGNVDALSNAILEILKLNEYEWKEYSNNSKVLMQKNFSIENYFVRVLEIYKEVLNLDKIKKKILFSMVNLYNGGAEKSLINLLNEIDYKKYEVDLLLFQKKGMFLTQISDEVNIIQPNDLKYLYNKLLLREIFNIKAIYCLIVKFFGNAIFRFFFYKNHRKMRQLRWKYFYKNCLKKLNKVYDVAIAYIECEPTYYIIDKTIALKKIVWVHNDYEKIGLDSNIDKKYFSQANYVVTISDKCKDSLVKYFPQYSNKFRCIQNITSAEKVREISLLKENIYFRTDEFRMLSIGRLNVQKGFDMAIEAARILKEQNLKFEWIIIGDGEQKDKLQDMIKKYNLASRVRLVGITSNPYVVIKNCDIIVQPSRYEGKSVVLDEAKILCKPILTTNYPTVNDQVNDRIGFIVDMNSEAIAQKIMEIIKNKEQLNAKVKELNSNNYGNESEIINYYMLFD